jgi:reactive intermediate/imine deaminase
MQKVISCFLIGCFVMLTLAWASPQNKLSKMAIFPQASGFVGGTDTPAIKIEHLIFISGQGAGSTQTSKDIPGQIAEAFKRLGVVANAAGGDLTEVVKVNVYLADLADASIVNEVMSRYFKKPYPARSTVQVSKLPRDHRIEVDAIMVIN